MLASLLLEITGSAANFSSSYAYIVKPVMWIFIGILVFFFFRNEVIPNFKYKKEVGFCVFVTILIYFFIYFSLGYIKGFAYNPYDGSLKGILSNLWMLVPVVLVKEYVRFYMINNCDKKRILLWAVLISILFTILDLNIFRMDTYFSSSLSILEFLLQTFLPGILTNFYLCYVSYYAGYGFSTLYTLLPDVLIYILPILPDLDWATLSIINSVVPFFSYVYINYLINKMGHTLDRKENKVVGLKGWLVMLASVIIMICFGLGLFPIQPLVIASDSMYPKIKRGDIVLIMDKDVSKIKKGEVIRYKLDNYYVVHRVVDIKTDENGQLQFITKGDNNDSLDLFPVKEYQVDGVIKYDIPVLGYPTLILNELLNTDAGDEVIVDKGRVN